jgi:hypothetical protein
MNAVFGARGTTPRASSSGTTGTSAVVWEEISLCATGITAITRQKDSLASCKTPTSREFSRTGLIPASGSDNELLDAPPAPHSLETISPTLTVVDHWGVPGSRSAVMTFCENDCRKGSAKSEYLNQRHGCRKGSRGWAFARLKPRRPNIRDPAGTGVTPRSDSKWGASNTLGCVLFHY